MQYSAQYPITAPADVPFPLSVCASVPMKSLLGGAPTNCKSERIRQLYERLMDMVRSNEVQSLDSSRYVCRRIGPEDEQASHDVKDIVNYSYNSRYLDERFLFEDVAYETSKESAVFTVQQDFGDTSLVLITTRVVLDKQLDCLQLFTGFTNATKAIEYVRFAYHPLLDLFPADAFDPWTIAAIDMHKRYLFRTLLTGTFEFLIQGEYRTGYVIMPPHIKRYMDESGFRLKPVPGATLRPSAVNDDMRNKFVRYWKPGGKAVQQPALYTLEFELNPLHKVVDNQTISL